MNGDRLEEATTAYVTRWATEQLGDLVGHPFVKYGGGTPAHVEFNVRFRLYGVNGTADADRLAARIKPTVEPTPPDDNGVRLIQIGQPLRTEEPGDPVVEVYLGAQAPERI